MLEILFSFSFWVVLLPLVFWLWQSYFVHSKVPPGPFGVPIFGHLFHMISKSKYPAEALRQLAEIYGDVMTLHMGNVKAVAFSSPDAIRDALKHEFTVDRVLVPVFKDRNLQQNLGLIFASGPKWQHTRRFTLRFLRDFGYGKSQSMDTVINEELQKFVNYLQTLMAKNNGIVTMDRMFELTFFNALWRLVIGKSYGYDDPEINRLLELHSNFMRSTSMLFHMSDVLPFLRTWFPSLTMKAKQDYASRNLYEYAANVLEEHKEYVKGNSEPRCLLDVFAKEIVDSASDIQDENSVFTDENCIISMLDLLLGGSETSSSTLSFGILYMLLNPSVQVKVQQEISSKIPKDAQIDMNMRQKLPYTQATVLEILRYSSVVPLVAPRQATDDFTFRGYSIKKGTAICANIYASHFSKSVWGDPVAFRPTRFLTQDGTVDKNVADLLSPFGGGKRICLGQTIAESTLFIFFASLMRTFKFEQVGSCQPTTDPVPGSIYSPQPFNVNITQRNN